MENDIRKMFQDFDLHNISFSNFIHRYTLLNEIREFYNYYRSNDIYINSRDSTKVLNKNQYDILENKKIMFFDELENIAKTIKDQLGEPILEKSEKIWINGHGLLAKDSRGVQNIRLEKRLYIHPKSGKHMYDDYEYFALAVVSFVFDKLGYPTKVAEVTIYNPTINNKRDSIVAGKICLNFGILWHRISYDA